jgi:hypothetical protein
MLHNGHLERRRIRTQLLGGVILIQRDLDLFEFDIVHVEKQPRGE